MRTPRDPLFAIVSWVIQWRRGPQDAQVGLKLVSFAFWLLTFQRPTLTSCVCWHLLDCYPHQAVTPPRGWLWFRQSERVDVESGPQGSDVLLGTLAAVFTFFVGQPPKCETYIRKKHQKIRRDPSCCCFFSSSKLTKINLDFYLGPFLSFLYSIFSPFLSPFFVYSSLYPNCLSFYSSLHFLSLLAPSTLSLVLVLYWVV